MPDPFKNIVYLRPDTIGDLVIFSSALSEFQAVWPDARHTLVVRPGYEKLAALFPASVHWQVARFNPFSQKPGECRSELAELLSELALLKPDLIVAPTINRTWLELAVAAHFPQARRVALGSRDVDPIFAAALRLELGVDHDQAFSETVTIGEHERDWANNHRIADQIAGRPLGRPFPRLEVPPAASNQAERILAEKKLVPGAWAAVFPAGIANVPIKAWPPQKFAGLVSWLQRERGMPVMLLGHVDEAHVLTAVAEAVAQGGSERPAIWLGQDGEIPLLTALLETARIYVGNDTGAMHLAAAVARPVVGIFGGGHWPRFRPTGRQTMSVVQPLACFGCNWDCHFGDAPCVKTISLADVQVAVSRVLETNEAIDEVRETQNLSPDALHLIAAATPRYTALQRDRIERQHTIEELKGETDLKDGEIDALKREADSKDAEINSLKREADTKDTEITGLKQETDAKDVEIDALKKEADAIKAELEAECAGKDLEIDQLKGAADTKDAEIAALKQVCNEREALIFTLTKHIENFQKMVGELNAAHGEKDQQITRLGQETAQLVAAAKEREAELAPRLQRLEELEWQYSRIPDPADTKRIAEDLEAKNVHIRNLDALVKHRDEELVLSRAAIVEREESLANHAAGYSGLEAAKYYGRLLTEKEAVIQTLHKACVEREAVIRQLASQATGIGPRVGKIWTATHQHGRLKLWAPFSEWLFKKTVEDYWMQIGILRHYDPRKLVWDKFPKPRFPDDRLPQIGIVTPSYGQPVFIESTMLSVLNQNYPKLLYVVQDGGSPDASPEIIARHAARLTHWESVKDRGQADAVRKGFSHLNGKLRPDDVMAWLNSDDFIAPRALRFVAEYFVAHPEVDCVYGHRIIIDPEDREIGRWIMPSHEPQALEWIDYIPQETMFWRKRAWDLVGGIDPSFQFALDWDLLARFTQAKLKVVRLPYFLGCFRVHSAQKTSSSIHTTGAEEMARVRTRFHGTETQGDMEKITAWARRVRFRGAVSARFHAIGIRK